MKNLLKPLQLTLAIVKPHVIANPVALEEVREMILKEEYKIVRSERRLLKTDEAQRFYGEHEGKFFYNRLVTFMVSGPIDLYVLAKENAISEWRRLMGPTKVFKTQYTDSETIRGRYGLSDTRNATHGSDSELSAKKEIRFFFPDFDVERWHREEEPLYRKDSNVTLDKDRFVHKLSVVQVNRNFIDL